MHLSFKSVCNKEHKGVICNMTPSSNSSRITRPFKNSLVITSGRVEFLSPGLFTGATMVHDLATVIICDGKVPTDREQSFFVCLYQKNFLWLSLGSNQYQAGEGL